VNILSAALNTSKDRICRARFTFETADPTHLDHVLRAVRSVPAVYEAYRIQQSSTDQPPRSLAVR
jgi:GTP diphosphokinase / guanosine-3',5'-bis(diphosphate) 3'-diphosphatase